MGEIIRSEYPELDGVLWDYHAKKIPADLAFHMYEERWGFIDKKRIAPKELHLIDELTEVYGNGLFMAA